MSKLKDVGLIKLLLLVGALVAANLYVGERASRLESQEPPISGPGPGFECVGPQGSSQSWCESHPLMWCDLANCTGDTLEP